MIPRRLAALLAVALVACSPAGTDGTTTTTAAPTTTVTTTVDGPNGEDRLVQMPTCANAPEEVRIVCEVVDLIDLHYVDEIEAATLALAAAEGLEVLEKGENSAPLICPIPADEFRATCEAAATMGLDSGKTAEVIVSAMVAVALDINSGYLTPEAVARIDEEDTGQIEGIGALVIAEDLTIEDENKQCSVMSETCRIYIVGTFEGAPASNAGLIRDDAIVGVDGEPIVGWSLEEVTARVRGRAGTEVTLTVEREGQTFDVTIVRAAVAIPSLEHEMVGGVGYVKLFSFSNGAERQFEQAVLDLLAGGSRHLIVDLRDNPGGFLDTAIGVASVFLPDGEVLVTEGPGTQIPYEVNGSAVVPNGVRVDVVVNRASASASEVLSGVLQERGRATVYGENTFGKNTVQQRYGLSNGGALRLTIARWVTPGGHDFGGVGITPDVPLELDAGATPEDVVLAVLDAS